MTVHLFRGHYTREESEMDAVSVRVICGVLAVVLIALIVMRRRQRAQQ